MELWKEIEEGNYSISNKGNVKNNKSGKVLSVRLSGGYNRVRINKHNYCVHRLVAKYFIENLENKTQVNHKDGNKLNNYVENLEWVTAQENIIHRHYILKKCIKAIKLIKDGKIYEFETLKKAGEELNINPASFSRLISGKYKSVKGYKKLINV